MSKSEKEILPPKFADKFLRFYCNHDLLEEIQGDIHELFEVRKKEYGSGKAKRLFVWDVLRFLRWSNLKKGKKLNSNKAVMFRNNFKIAFRILRREKIPSLINTMSLTLGITAVSLIYLYVNDELTFDRFHEKSDQTYRLIKNILEPDGAIKSRSGYHPLPLAPNLVNDFPEIEKSTRVGGDRFFVRNGETMIEEAVTFADSTVFDIFTFPLSQGHPTSVFNTPRSVVLSESMAVQLFSSLDVLGQTFEIRLGDSFQEYTVTGVARDIPRNSTVRFEILLAYSELPYYQDYKNYWRLNTDETYVLLNANTDVSVFKPQLEMHWTKYLSEDVEEMQQSGNIPFKYDLQPLTDIHLTTDVSGHSKASDPVYSYILASIALVILLLGCSNFTLLSMGRSASRSREIAVRKVIGAKRKQLMSQFWTEAIALSFLSAILAIGLTGLILPTFNELADKQFEFSQLLEWRVLGVLLLISLFSGFLSGSYPAVLLSGFKVLDIFRKKVKFGGTSVLSKGLITFQFALSIVLLLGTLVIYQQLDYLKTAELGFQQENQLVVKNRLGSTSKEFELFKNRMAQNPNIESFTAVSSSFTKGRMRSSFIAEEGREIPYLIYRIDPNYLETLGIEIAEGRNFDANLATDSSQSVLVNEEMLKELGPDFQLGDQITGFENAGLKKPRVIGVLKNYHMESLASGIKPVILSIYRYSGIGLGDIIVRVRPNTAGEVIKFLEEEWQIQDSEALFTYSFLEDDLETQYRGEEKWAKIIQYSTLWAIAISALGLLGLTMLIILAKTKEIGIRKVLGANIKQIFLVVSKQFNWLMLIAVLIAVPSAIYFIELWLNGFAYRVEISPILISIGIGSIFIITMSMIGVNAFRASTKNPAESLRIE